MTKEIIDIGRGQTQVNETIGPFKTFAVYTKNSKLKSYHVCGSFLVSTDTCPWPQSFSFDYDLKPGEVPPTPFVFCHHIADDYYSIPLVVDRDRKFWVSGRLSTREDMENRLEDDNPEYVTVLRKALGMKPKLPYEARWALENGWTPPDSLNLDDFEP